MRNWYEVDFEDINVGEMVLVANRETNAEEEAEKKENGNLPEKFTKLQQAWHLWNFPAAKNTQTKKQNSIPTPLYSKI